MKLYILADEVYPFYRLETEKETWDMSYPIEIDEAEYETYLEHEKFVWEFQDRIDKVRYSKP